MNETLNVPPAPNWAKNQVALGVSLGVTRKTIQRWRTEASFPRPRSNGNWSIPEVRAWMESNDRPLRAPGDFVRAQIIRNVERVLVAAIATLAPQLASVTAGEAESMLRFWLHDVLGRLRQYPVGQADEPSAPE